MDELVHQNSLEPTVLLAEVWNTWIGLSVSMTIHHNGSFSVSSVQPAIFAAGK